MAVRPLRHSGVPLAVSLLALALLLLPASASAAPAAGAGCPAAVGAPDREYLFVNVCGPREVTRNTNYDYTVVLTNRGHTSTGKATLAVLHYDPIVRSSIPYREASGRVDFQMREAVWTLANLEPGHSFRVTFALSFRQHGRSSLFIVRAAGQHRGAGGGMKKDVFFK